MEVGHESITNTLLVNERLNSLMCKQNEDRQNQGRGRGREEREGGKRQDLHEHGK